MTIMSVDELWQQLRQGAGRPLAARRSGVSLSGLAGMPGIASHVVSVSDKNSNRKEREPRASFIAQLEQRQGAGDGGSPDERTQALLVRAGCTLSAAAAAPLPVAALALTCSQRLLPVAALAQTCRLNCMAFMLLSVPLQACLQRDVNGLSDPDRTTRRRAVRAVTS